MFNNYLKTAWKVLLRRKVFSFISLFGIALTLTVLLVLTTMLDNYLYPAGPEQTNRNYLSVSRLTLESEDRNNQWTSRPGYKFIIDHVGRLKSPQKIAIFTQYMEGASFLNGDKLSNHFRRTDATYWDILSFELVEGRFYNQQEFKSGEMLMIINQKTASEFFGTESALNKNITVNNQNFQVIGVVKDVSYFENIAYADMWVPYTTTPSSAYLQGMTSGWEAILYHQDETMLSEIQSEFINLLQEDFISPEPETYHLAFSGADTPLEKLARNILTEKGFESGAKKLLGLFSLLIICFMLLPSINLINLNISRILERSSEIGVRKAFGASSNQLVLQFVIENILITALGGIIGLILSWLLLIQVEASQLIPGANFSFSWHSYFYAISLIIVFGLISGTYPAYKMSKLHPVAALKGGA